MEELTGKVALITGEDAARGACTPSSWPRWARTSRCDIVEQDAVVPYPTGRAGDLEETARRVEELGRRCMTGVVDVRAPLRKAAMRAAP